MTRRLLNTSLILLLTIAIFVAMLFAFAPALAYADDTYTITWVNGSDVLETDNDVAAGTTPTYDGETPTKAADAQYTYAFAGWSPEVYAADKDQTYTAVFTPTLRSYTITWKNGDTTLETDTNVDYGETPSYDGDTPTKASTVSKYYTFNGWSPEVSSVVGDQIYTAQFSEDDILYTYIWEDYNYTYLLTVHNTPYGTTYSGETPTRGEDYYNTYAFDHWDETIDNTTVYEKAVYASTPKLYTVYYKDYDGTTLQTNTNVTYDNIPEYTGATPTRASDAQYTYTFTNFYPGFDPDNELVIIYTPQFSSEVNKYTITWVNGSNVLQSGLVEYGVMPEYTEATPTKANEGGYYFTFTGWDPEITAVSGEQTYEAQFSQAPITFKLTYGTGENDYINVVYNTSYQLPVLTQDGKWLNRWEYSSEILAYHNGESLNAYTYTTDIIATPIWDDFEITVDTNFVSIENKTPATYQLTVTSTGDITYTSSNDKVFTVSQTGLVTCVGKGRAIITIAQLGGGTSETCVFVSVDKIITNVDNILAITINEGINNQRYLVLCDGESTLEYVSNVALAYLGIQNDYVDRTDIGVELSTSDKVKDVFIDGSTLNINLIYNVAKETNNAASYRLSKEEAEYNTPVYIYDLVAVGDNKLGNIIVKNDKNIKVDVVQSERSFIMPACDVVTDILVKEAPIASSTIRKVEIKSQQGFDSRTKVVVNRKTNNEYSANINIGPNKEAVAVIDIKFLIGEEEVETIGEYTLTITVPEELLGKDGVEVFYYAGDKTIVKQVYFEGKDITITLAGSGDIVFAANVHESTTYLYWLIILLLFLDAFLGMILIILATNYTDALARRKALNGYSVAFAPIILLGAVVPAEIAVVAFLGLVFVVELIAIAWLSLKLTNKYFMYSTYHKLYMPKYDDEDY